MHLGLDSGMLDEHTGISSKTTASTANMSINLKDLLNTARNHQRRCQTLLNSQQDTILGLNTNGSRSKLDC